MQGTPRPSDYDDIPDGGSPSPGSPESDTDAADDDREDSRAANDERRPRSRRWWWPSTLTVVAIAFFVSIGGILATVWAYADMIVVMGRGLSILILGVMFIIVLNLIAIILMLVLLNTIKDRDD